MTTYVHTAPSLIASGTTGEPVAMGGYALAAIAVPASMASTSVSFEVSFDNGTTWLPLYDDLNQLVSVSISSSARCHSLRRVLPLGVEFVRPVASASETAKTITLIGQRIV
jgi:hypothetical protein